MELTVFVDARRRASLALEARYEFLRLLRTPSFVVPTLLFPAMFYLLFGVLLARRGDGFQAAHYMMAGYTVFGVMMPGLFGFGAVVATEREKGLLTLKCALPMPRANFILAKLGMAMLFALLIFGLLALLGVVAGGVRLDIASWLRLGVVALFGVVPFCAIGLWIGTHVGAQAAPAVINLIYLPMSFLSGLWVPLFALPPLLQKIAPLWPAYHLSQLAFAAIGQPSAGNAWTHAVVLAGVAAAMLALAQRRLARS